MQDLIKFAGPRILILIALLIAAILIYQIAEPKFNNDFWSFALSVLIPLLVLSGISSFVLADRFNKDFLALSQREAGASTEANGWVAISGNITSEQPENALQNSQEFGNLLAFRYQITEEEDHSRIGDRGSKKFYRIIAEGYFQKPLVVKNDLEEIAISGFLDLRHLERDHFENGVLEKCLAAAIRQPNWVPKVIVRKLAFTNVTNRLNINWIFRDENDNNKSSLNVKALREGDSVHVFGRLYNNQLFPSEFSRLGISVYGGATEELLLNLKEDGRAFKATAAIALLVAVGLSLWLLFK